jgi:hypothetical protein
MRYFVNSDAYHDYLYLEGQRFFEGNIAFGDYDGRFFCTGDHVRREDNIAFVLANRSWIAPST